VAEYMEEYGYGDDWTLPENPEIAAENASGFLVRLARDRGEFAAIDYDAESLPAKLSLLADPLLDRRPHLIPGVSSKTRTSDPCRGAEIRDPRVETLDGRRVNVLMQGERYVYAYDVAFTESCPGAECWMVIRDRHGNGSVIEVRPFDDAADAIGPGATRRVRFDLDCRLQPGMYFVDAQVTTSPDGIVRTFAHRIVAALLIFVHQAGSWGAMAPS
jgi:hypothetical protein